MFQTPVVRSQPGHNIEHFAMKWVKRLVTQAKIDSIHQLYCSLPFCTKYSSAGSFSNKSLAASVFYQPYFAVSQM